MRNVLKKDLIVYSFTISDWYSALCAGSQLVGSLMAELTGAVHLRAVDDVLIMDVVVTGHQLEFRFTVPQDILSSARSKKKNQK